MAEVNDRVIKASESGNPDLYPSQSSKVRNGQELAVRESQKPEKPRMEAVIDKAAKVRRKGKFQQMMESMGTYLWNDILKPAMQATIEDLVNNGVHYAIHGEAQGRRKRHGGSRMSFSDEYERRRSGRRDDREEIIEDGWENISYDSKQEAMKVVYALKERADMYNYATILDFYDASHRTCNDYTKDYKGWTLEDLDRAEYGSYYDREEHMTRYFIILPKPVRID